MQATSELLKGSPPAKSLIALFEATAAKRGDLPAIRHKRGGAWVDVSWKELARRARDVADGLASLGVAPGDRIAIIGETQLEWILADMGILGAGAVTVTIYQSNMAEECAYILKDSGARFVFCDTPQQAAKLQEVRSRLPGAARRRLRERRRLRRLPARAGRAGEARGGVARGEPGRPRGAGLGARARGRGEHHLHLRHHREPEGRRPDPLGVGLRGAGGRADRSSSSPRT